MYLKNPTEPNYHLLQKKNLKTPTDLDTHIETKQQRFRYIGYILVSVHRIYLDTQMYQMYLNVNDFSVMIFPAVALTKPDRKTVIFINPNPRIFLTKS